MFTHSFLILLAGCALAAVLYVVKTRLSRLWGIIAFAAVVVAAGSLLYWPGSYTPADRLPLGIDLAGGTTLVYDVQVPEQSPDAPGVVVDRTIATLSKRVDPTGTRNLIWRRLGDKRLQVQMPAPNTKVAGLRQAWEAARKAAVAGGLTADALEAQLAAGSTDGQLQPVQAAWNARVAAKAGYEAAEKAWKAKGDAQYPAFLAAEDHYVAAKKKFTQAEDAVLRAGSFNAVLLDKWCEIPDEKPKIGKDGQPVKTRREAALADLQQAYPGRAEALAKAAAAFEAYEKVKGALESPEDLDRLLQGSGRVEFRIAPRSNDPELGDPTAFIRKLEEHGPRAFTDKDAYAWFEIDSIAQYLDINDDKADGLKELARHFGIAEKGVTSDRVVAAINTALEASLDPDPAKAGANAAKIESLVHEFRGVVAKVYNGKIYVLLGNDIKRNAMTADQGWAVKSPHMAYDEVGRPCVSFRMDSQGAELLGKMTGAHVGRLMAVLLDGRILTTPNLQSKLSDGGQITGRYTQQEVDYLVNTMRAGSLDGRISGAPVSQKTTGPELGADNLRMGKSAAMWSFVVVGLFMAFYYFVPGLTAVIALGANLLLVLGIMAIFNSTFTMPGIAGMVLTIGIAVDANVLIYERIREETFHGKDLLSAIHDGHHRSMATIIDSHVTQLLVAWVLAGMPPFNWVETPADLKGFAVTLGIGILVSLFTSLFGAYVFLDLFVWLFKPKKLHMLPTVWPALQRALTPNIPWVRLGKVFLPITSVFCVVAIVFAVSRGRDLLDVEFRAGSQVGFRLKAAEGDRHDLNDKPVREKMKLEEVREKIDAVIKVATLVQQDKPVPPGDAAVAERARGILQEAKLRYAQAEKEFATGHADHKPDPVVDFTQFSAEYLIGVGAHDGDAYGEFSLKTLITDSRAVTEVVQTALAGDLDAEPPVAFAGSALAPNADSAHLLPVTGPNLGEVLKREIPAGVDARVNEFQGGVAVVVEDLKPALTLAQMQDRLSRMRNQPPHDKLTPRQWKVVPLVAADGVGEAKTWSAFAVVAADSQTSYINEPGTLFGKGGLAVTQRALVRDALQRASAFDDVTVFGSQISGTMQKDAFFALLVSFLGIAGYVWFRFNSMRFGVATVVALLHDVGVALGAVALSGWLSHTAFGRALGIHDFKLNLAMVAALLTVMGYSVNDTVVVFDRIREYRSKVKVVTAQHINDAINHTLSRTLLTTGTVIISSVMLYAIGGPAVHGFAYAMLVGVLIGTWSSIALAAPLLLVGSGGSLSMETHEDELADLRLQPSAPGEPVGV